MKEITCPVCNSIIAESEQPEIGLVTIKDNLKKTSYAPSTRIRLMMRIIYLLIGALLALSGVSIKALM